MVKATGKGSKKISGLPAKQMPIIVCFKCARKDGRRPTAWWMDRGCFKGHIAKAIACGIPKRHDWHGDRWKGGGQALSKMTCTLFQSNYSFTYSSKPLCMMGILRQRERFFESFNMINIILIRRVITY